MNGQYASWPFPAQTAPAIIPQSHGAPAAAVDIDAHRLIADFEQLDAYGRRVALAMMCSLVRLARTRAAADV
jgi:hypothetical protein